jgi:hypothetical protein
MLSVIMAQVIDYAQARNKVGGEVDGETQLEETAGVAALSGKEA